MGKVTVIVSSRIFVKAGAPVVAGGIVVKNGRIVRLCRLDEVKELARSGEAHEVHDFGNAFVCPGFHDAHQHVLHAALFPSALATEFRGESEADCVAHMHEWEQRAPRDGWLISHGWRNMMWNDHAAPTRHSLDQAFPERPVCMYSGDAHTVWMNSAGLAAMGINDETEPPEGGSFERDADGRLTGVLREAAGMKYMGRVLKTIPRASMIEAYETYFRKLLAQGVTSVCDMALSAVPGFDGVQEDVYEDMLAQGRLPLRVSVFPQLTSDLSRIRALQGRLTGNMLRAPGTKQFFDGVSSAHTAWLMEPYVNPYYEGDCGRPTVSSDEMRNLVLAAAREGIAVRIHTIGDRAIHEAIGIFEDARKLYGDPAQGRNSLEHLEGMLQSDIPRMASANLVASCQPQHIAIDMVQPVRDLGAERASLMWQFRSLLEAGVQLAFGTDAPVVSPRTTDALACATYRVDPETRQPQSGWIPEERISMEQAIGAYTLGSVQAVGRDKELGSIEPGKLADLAVFDTDLLTCDFNELREAKTIATFVNGVLAYEA